MSHKEVWREIEFTGGDYSVSNTGRVRSNERKAYDGRRLKCRELKTFDIKPLGYLGVALRIEGKTVKYLVHRLVYCVFNGVDISTQLDVHHKDNNKKNNNLDNLELLTRSENVLESYRLGNRKKIDADTRECINESIRQSRGRPIARYDLEGNLVSVFNCLSSAKKLGFDASRISKCANKEKRAKTAYGYIWEWWIQ